VHPLHAHKLQQNETKALAPLSKSASFYVNPLHHRSLCSLHATHHHPLNKYTATLAPITTAYVQLDPPNADIFDNEIVALVIIRFVFLLACGLFP
jgi:hypothetical protein